MTLFETKLTAAEVVEQLARLERDYDGDTPADVSRALREWADRIDARAVNGPDPDVGAIWQAWPRKVSKASGLRAIKAALRRVDFATLLEAVEQFAESVSDKQGRFVPHCSTWMNGDRWLDDRAEWYAHREGNDPTAGLREWHEATDGRDDDAGLKFIGVQE